MLIHLFNYEIINVIVRKLIDYINREIFNGSKET